MVEIRSIAKRIDRTNLGQSLRALEINGDINSEGDISVATAINEVRGHRIEYYLFNTSKTHGQYVQIGLSSGKSGKSLVITKTGKLYISK